MDYCLHTCPDPCVAPPLLAAIWQAETSNYHQGSYISASLISGAGCLRQVFYERDPEIELYDHATRRYWPFRGTHAHSIVERAGEMLAPSGWLQELRMTTELEYPELPAPVFDDQGVWTGDFDTTKPLLVKISGTTDCYNFRLRSLWDMKSMADAKAEMMIAGKKGGSFSPFLEDRWVWQTNIYRWLVSRTPIPTELKAQFPEDLAHLEYFPAPEYLGIQGIAMMHIPRTGSLATSKKSGTNRIDAVPVLPLDEIEQYVRREALQAYKALVLRRRPRVVEVDDAWLCKSCPFNGDLIPGERCHPEQERLTAQLKASLVQVDPPES